MDALSPDQIAEFDLRSRRENPFLEPLLEQLGRLGDFSRVSVYQVVRDYVTLITYRGSIPQATALSLSFSTADSGTTEAIREKRPTFGTADPIPPQSPTSHTFLPEWLALDRAFPAAVLHVPILDGNVVFGVIDLGHQKPDFFSAELAGRIGRLARRHIEALKRAIHYSELRQQAAVARMLLAVQKAIIARLEPEELMQLTVEKAIQLLYAHSAVLLLAEDDALVVAAQAGRPIAGLAVGDRCRGGGELPAEPGAVVELESLCAEAVQAHTGWPALAVALGAGLQRRGALVVVEKRLGIFDHVDRRALSALVDAASIGLENGQLYRQAHQIAVLEERNRLSGELHDQFAQALSYLQMQTSLLRKRLQEGNLEQASARAGELQHVLGDTSAMVSEAIFDLRHAGGIAQGLLETLQDYLVKYEASFGIQAQLVLQAERLSFPAETEIQLVRIIQEALTNARRHAGPTRVIVTVSWEGDHTCIQVEDNGCGFNVEATLNDRSGSRFGTRIMRERAASFGGRVTFDSRRGGGTRVKICIPAGEEA